MGLGFLVSVFPFGRKSKQIFLRSRVTWLYNQVDVLSYIQPIRSYDDLTSALMHLTTNENSLKKSFCLKMEK